jgi:hypothetical protein
VAIAPNWEFSVCRTVHWKRVTGNFWTHGGRRLLTVREDV